MVRRGVKLSHYTCRSPTCIPLSTNWVVDMFFIPSNLMCPYMPEENPFKMSHRRKVNNIKYVDCAILHEATLIS